MKITFHIHYLSVDVLHSCRCTDCGWSKFICHICCVYSSVFLSTFWWEWCRLYKLSFGFIQQYETSSLLHLHFVLITGNSFHLPISWINLIAVPGQNIWEAATDLCSKHVNANQAEKGKTWCPSRCMMYASMIIG